MEMIFSNYGIKIFTNNNQFILRYDSGEIVVQPADIVITEADAKIAQQSAQDAYNVIIKYQNASKKQ